MVGQLILQQEDSAQGLMQLAQPACQGPQALAASRQQLAQPVCLPDPAQDVW